METDGEAIRADCCARNGSGAAPAASGFPLWSREVIMQAQRGVTPPTTGGEEPLLHTVRALGQEVRDLRASARLRAVIEQAKGILVERHGISLDEAFAQLRAMSQEHNVRLVEVAATIVGVTVTDDFQGIAADHEGLVDSQLPPSAAVSKAWLAFREQPDVKSGVASALVDALAASTDEGDQAAQLLLDLLLPHGVRVLMIYESGVDGSLRLMGTAGDVPSDLISSWRSIPPSANIPYIRALLENRAFFWPNREAQLEEFPDSLSASTAIQEVRARAIVPVQEGLDPAGVIGLMWHSDEVFDDVRKQAITTTVQRVAPLLMRSVSATNPELVWLESVMRTHMDPWLLLEAVVGENGVVTDFVVRDSFASADDGAGWAGRRALEVWPHMASEATLSSLISLMRTGGTWSTSVTVASDLPWGIPGTQMRAVRLGSRVALVWRSPAS